MQFKLLIATFALLYPCVFFAQTPGCTDPLANNFEINATINNGSCIYPAATISPASSLELNEALNEISGMIWWDGFLWAHNDDTDTHLYSIEPTQANTIQSYSLPEVINTDWEEISQDENYVYIGDFGNNVSGNRTDLNILRVEKESLSQGIVQIDTIAFVYENQITFDPQNANETNFDCEAFIVSSDSIYLFTKQWINAETSVYALSKSPGEHVASFKASFDVNGLVTGACYFEEERIIALCGYSSNLLQPFIYLLYDFQGSNFFSGNKRKISIDLLIHQIEGISSEDGLTWYLSNEQVTQKPFINIDAKLHQFDLHEYLDNYINTINSAHNFADEETLLLYPNPATDFLVIPNVQPKEQYVIYDLSGQIIEEGKTESGSINVHFFKPGTYILVLSGQYTKSYIFNKL